MNKNTNAVSLPSQKCPNSLLEANQYANKLKLQDFINKDNARSGVKNYFYVIDDDYLLDLCSDQRRYIAKLTYDQVKPESEETQKIFYQILCKKGCYIPMEEMRTNLNPDEIFYHWDKFTVGGETVQQDRVLAFIDAYWEMFFVLEEDYVKFINSTK